MVQEDENLNELLGFDPTTGLRLENRSGLSSFPKSGEYRSPQISEEVQREFVRWIALNTTQSQQTRSHTIPQLLFAEFQAANKLVVREYFAHNSSQENPLLKFQRQGEVWFAWINGRFEPRLLSLGSENASEHVAMLFNLGDPELVLQANIQNRYFSLRYHLDRLSELSFSLAKQGVNPENPQLTTYERTLELSQEHIADVLNGLRPGFGKGDSEFYLDTNQQQTSILLVRKQNGTSQDQVLIPISTDKEKITNTLFPEQLIKNPFESTPNLDNAWRFADLLTTVGVRWERF